MMKPAARLGLAGVWFALLLPVGAQTQTKDLRDIDGQVRDEHREPLTGAVVYLENEESQEVKTFVTDNSGHFLFKRVRGDTDYQLWASFRGTLSKKHLLSKFDSHGQRTIELSIRLH